MGLTTNILIVEDDPQWRGACERATVAHPVKPVVRAASDFASAVRHIAETKFAVALVDIGLDVSDDSNTDGLGVMREIRVLDDETSIVVVTGRSGSDVLRITRDAIKTYHAFEIIGKRYITPSDLRGLIAAGVAEYRRLLPPPRDVIQETLRGPDINAMAWDEQAMRATGFKDGQPAFHGYLTELFGDYLPLVARGDGVRAAVRIGDELIYGACWSRSATCAVGLCFGSAKAYEGAAGTPYLAAGLFGVKSAGQPVRELARHGIRGAVFPLKPLRRDDFVGSNAAAADRAG